VKEQPFVAQAEASLSQTLSRLDRNTAPSDRRQGWRARLAPSPMWILIGVLALLVAAALFAPWITPHDPVDQSLRDRLVAPYGWHDGTSNHLFGTDQLGRDALSRVIYGARVSLGIGLSATVIGMLTGATLGLIAGFRRGLVEEILMLLVDASLAVPTFVIALTAISLAGNQLWVLIAVIGLSGWATYARLTRSLVLATRDQPYVEAARVAGASPRRLVLRHILPNIVAQIIVLATMQMTGVILLEASLSFLGMGVQPPTPSWGSMVSEGRAYLNTAWWITVMPAAGIVITTVSVGLVGDWLRDRLDPTLRKL